MNRHQLTDSNEEVQIWVMFSEFLMRSTLKLPPMPHYVGKPPDALLIELVTEGVEQLKHGEPANKAVYDPALDPLAPFIGTFDSGDDEPGWIKRHDMYFARNDVRGEQDDNKK
jgi:hypothetical protein